MRVYKLPNNPELPAEILELLAILNRVNFFADGLLVGSWAVLFYQDVPQAEYLDFTFGVT